MDDEKSYVELMAQMMGESLQCEIHAFTRPKEALAGLATLSAAVVVTDYFMPQMDGVEFIKKASKISPDAAFIMISGHDLDGIKRELAPLKRLKLRLQKPFGSRPLTEAVLKAWPGDDVPALRG